jgi:Dissimilatory sulfite reductase (desulfoviridin), alpha and beta subunits
MRIDPEKCIGCGICVPYCPAKAITVENKKARIDEDQCVECGNCIRPRVVKCPKMAIFEPEENKSGPRLFRRFLSDPSTATPTGVPGRGTEEVKTNDVTARVQRGEIGIAIEVGRPNVGATISDLEKVFAPLAAKGIEFEECNPTTMLWDPATGRVKDDMRNERVMSAIIETSIPIERAEEVLAEIQRIAKTLDTVFSLDVICCYDENGTVPIRPVFERLGIKPRMNAKVNLGMGRPFKTTREEKSI